jgi:hypothetical protein
MGGEIGWTDTDDAPDRSDARCNQSAVRQLADPRATSTEKRIQMVSCSGETAPRTWRIRFAVGVSATKISGLSTAIS